MPRTCIANRRLLTLQRLTLQRLTLQRLTMTAIAVSLTLAAPAIAQQRAPAPNTAPPTTAIQPASPQVAPPAPALQPAAPVVELTLAARLQSIEQSIERMRRRAGVPGLSLVVVKDDKVVLVRGFGLREVAKRLPVTAETLFPVGSVSKTFTALAAMQALDDKALSLDDAPRKYLPEFKLKDADADSRVTLRDLLSHRTGVERADLAWIAFNLNRADLIKGIASLNQVAPVGTAFNYNNYLFLAAGEVVARAKKQTYEGLVESRILRPLGMARTTFSVARLNADPDHSLGYAANPTAPPTLENMLATDSIAAAAGLISSARDMGEFVRMLVARGQHNGRSIVSQASFQTMTTKQVRAGDRVDYGLGLFLRRWKGAQVIEHGGNVFGYSALIAAIPERGVGFALLTNGSQSPISQDAVMASIWSRLLNPELPQAAPKQDPAVPAASRPVALDPMAEAGPYAVAGGQDFVVSEKPGGGLVLTIPGEAAYPLIALGGRRYRMGAPAPAGHFATFRPAKFDANATELHLKLGQNEGVLAKRVSAPLDAMSATYANAIAVYENKPNKDLKVEIANIAGKIALIVKGQPAYPLLPKGNDTFQLSGPEPAGAWLVSLKREPGGFSGLTLQQPNGTFEFQSLGLLKVDISAEDLRRRIVAALGGQAALAAKRTLVQDFEAELKGTGLSGRGQVTWKAPFSMASELTLQVLGQDQKTKIREVFNGSQGQTVADGQAPKSMKSGDIDWQFAESPQELLNWSQLYKDLTVLGRTRFDGCECYAIRRTLQSGRVLTFYYDIATLLPAGIEGLKPSSAANDVDVPTTSYSRAWRALDGVKVSFELVEHQPSVGLTTTIKISNARWNVPVDDAVFKLK